MTTSSPRSSIVRSRSTGRWAPAGVLGVLVALAAGALLTVTGAVLAPASAAADACGPAPQGKVAVVVVIDRGSGAVSSRCAIVAQGATGLDAMRAVGHDVRLKGGFVCGIDGLPATGCGVDDASLPYWRYWHASPGGQWSYSGLGAGGYRLPARCAVEGWSWSDSPAGRTPPRVAAPTPTCEAVPTTAPPATSAPAPAPVAPAVPGGSAVAPGASVPNAPAGQGAPGTSTPSPQVAGASTVAPPSSTTPVDPGASAVEAGDVDEPSSDVRDVDGEQAAAEVLPASDGSRPWGVLVGVVLVVALGGAAVVRSRTRDAAGSE